MPLLLFPLLFFFLHLFVAHALISLGRAGLALLIRSMILRVLLQRRRDIKLGATTAATAFGRIVIVLSQRGRVGIGMRPEPTRRR